jgi:hypothetical protein
MPKDQNVAVNLRRRPKWLRSETARLLFLYSSWAVILMGLFMLFMLLPWFRYLQMVPQTKLAFEIVGGTLGVIGAPASLIIWFGMIAFCLREDSSPLTARIFWVVLFFLTAWFGSAAYFFRVYRRQVQFGGATST